MKQNNDNCKDVGIDHNVLHNLPINISIFNSLRPCDYVSNVNVNDTKSINSFADDESLELGPAPSTTGLHPNREYACNQVLCLHQSFAL